MQKWAPGMPPLPIPVNKNPLRRFLHTFEVASTRIIPVKIADIAVIANIGRAGTGLWAKGRLTDEG